MAVAPDPRVIALIICVVPFVVAGFILYVVYGPVPARRASFARHVPAMPLATLPVAPIRAEPVFVAPAPAPVAMPASVEAPLAVTAVEPPRAPPVTTIPPGLAPFVRPRSGPLPPLRRAARGTDAPPPPYRAPAPIERIPEMSDSDFDLEEMTHVDDRLRS
jgi:hypothetical protein